MHMQAWKPDPLDVTVSGGKDIFFNIFSYLARFSYSNLFGLESLPIMGSLGQSGETISPSFDIPLG